ncbi:MULTISPECIES: flagellar protein export ATPase FliI [unclassified Gilliamella]|uniref:flagellar protein export ATPase FliI n=1 Tax=unclassified Gilliamella TaxID=2685620 RepID=UPI002A0D99EF|nr:flagellar protein export ATPase FliI [Gilliamella sp. B3722]MCX8608413.1 flagellar protein export ATPase FliI [Gilliamella sp. B3771]MCX8611018.1 flagellar protein export ATPase FliI [Gilliamella sp. B3891]MCX8613486.1 flagellar protein export ATPase FliI [Gilliamella sp. B3773]MCX8616400.1 flagellar protein export ATPase FliI [Gilliamella sp. B3770]MCX8620741.1 flagellar protein export ATPase FliI [Gilliamella sp. B3892]MCX8623227.1 flagellar protein export ATPase FliI [Gilliamella sp. B3
MTKIDRATTQLQSLSLIRQYGRLVKASGLVLEAVGLKLPLGSNCFVERQTHGKIEAVECEVVGFNEQTLYLMPFESTDGILLGARVYTSQYDLAHFSHKVLPIGMGLLGRVVDAMGKPLDGKPLPEHIEYEGLASKSLNPLQRTPISQVLDVGIRAINALLTVGQGQRMGLFAGSGVGKSVLLGMMARYTKADIIVVGLIGERGREVKDFIENILGEEGLTRSVVVAAPADVSPLLRLQGATYATKIAENFREQGFNVLLIMDSLTRYAMAQREIALAIGEPPATKGYPPSVFAKLPALVERAGNDAQGKGAITAFYTVLTEGDDQQDPIADSARAILDGHIVLSRQLAESGHYPAIDIEASISRVMTDLTAPEDERKSRLFKQLFSSFQRNRDLINVGAYVSGTDRLLDQAIKLFPAMQHFLQQGIDEHCSYQEAYQQLLSIVGS